MINLWHGALSWWKSTFSSLFVPIFWWFLPSNTPIMLYNIPYWWSFLSQGNQWTKYLAHLKIRRPKPCLLMFASLVALDGHSPAADHSANCQFDSGMKWWIHVSSIITYLCKGHWHTHTRGLPWGLPEVVGTVQQVHCSRRRLLWKGLEFHVCIINKSAHTKKSLETYLMILVWHSTVLGI